MDDIARAIEYYFILFYFFFWVLISSGRWCQRCQSSLQVLFSVWMPEVGVIEAGRGVLPSDKMKSQRSNSVLKIGFSLSTQ